MQGKTISGKSGNNNKKKRLHFDQKGISTNIGAGDMKQKPIQYTKRSAKVAKYK